MVGRGDRGGARMAEHRCGTCKHFEAAPMWKKGWCRNPLLYAPTQSHLVAEEDLDCNRGMGSYWEPLESELPEQEPATTRFTAPPPRTIAPAHPGGGATASGPTAALRRDRAAAAPTPVGIAPGAKVVVKTAGDGANIRGDASINASPVTAVANGTALTITGDKKDADGYTWWPVQGDGFSGWVASALIEPAP